jgi:hypothetical protein
VTSFEADAACRSPIDAVELSFASRDALGPIGVLWAGIDQRSAADEGQERDRRDDEQLVSCSRQQWVPQ